MVRFARAKGSKASNERVAEDATSWAEMKQQLDDKKKDVETTKKRKQAESTRKENYDKFLKDVDAEESKNNKWADFPVAVTTLQKQKRGKEKAQPTETDNHAENVNDVNDNVQATAAPLITKNAKKRKLNVNTNKKADPAASPAKKIKHLKEVKTPKKPVEEMTAEEQKKFEKKKEKKLKQLEKRKLKKQKLNEQKKQEINKNGVTENVRKPIHNNNDKTQNQIKTPSKVKKFDPSKEHKRRKPQEDGQKVTINGKEIDLVYYNGFPIKREDGERLTELRKQMIAKGLPHSEVKAALKLERRRAEKSLAREKKNVCFNCRLAGHVLSVCPEITAKAGSNVDTAASGICFKCGSTEHMSFVCKVVKSQEFRFASCFICNEQGHLSWQCPDNARGLYPKGGACKLCGDVTHLKKDCPKYVAEQESKSITLDTLVERSNPDMLQASQDFPKLTNAPRVHKIIKF